MNNLQTIVSLSRTLTKRFFRDKTALFFTFIFPLVFLFVFGGIFGNDSGPNFNVALIESADNEFASAFIEQSEQTGVFSFTEITDFEQAKERLGRGEYDAILELPEDFGALSENGKPSGELISYYDESDQQFAQTFAGVVDAILEGLNAQYVDAQRPFTLSQQPINTTNLSQFDYTFSGLIGFAMLSLGIFSMTEGFAGDKKNGSLRRLRVAPIKAWQLIIATALTRIFVGILVVTVMFIVAVSVFSFDMRGDYLSLLLLTILGTTCLFGFGMAIAGWAKDGNQAAPLANLVSFPMMFLSGVFFPRFLMPDFLQSITAYIPLTPIVDGLRMVLTEGKTLLDLGPQLAVIAVWIVVIYVISFRTFRWD